MSDLFLVFNNVKKMLFASDEFESVKNYMIANPGDNHIEKMDSFNGVYAEVLNGK